MTKSLLPVLLLSASIFSQGFTDVSASSGMSFPVAPTAFFGRGIAVADFNGDGIPDLIAPTGDGNAPFRHYRGTGNATFTDVTATSGLGSPVGLPKGAIPADVDADGDLDLFVAVLYGNNLLFINDGTGSFTEEAAARGLSHNIGSYGAAFGDLDKDGDIDLFVSNRFDPISGNQGNDALYWNQGNGTFVEGTIAAGINNLGFSLGVQIIDYDDDGWPDIAIANEKGTNGTRPPNVVYRNNGNGTFFDVAPAIGADLAIEGMGIDFADVRNDGGWDFYATDWPPSHHLMMWNPSSSRYTDQASSLQVVGGYVGWSTFWFDYDNDGWQDLSVSHTDGPDRLYRNAGPSGAFISTGAALGMDTLELIFCGTYADLNGDGRLDVIKRAPLSGMKIYRNDTPAGNWLNVRLASHTKNRNGLGAIITATAGGLTQRRSIRTNHGFLSGRDPNAHFGLGTASFVNLRVQWPSGVVTTHENVPANQSIVLEEARLEMLAAPTAGAVVPLRLKAAGDAGRPYLLALSLGAQPGIPLPDGRVIGLNLDPVLLLTVGPGNPNPFLAHGPGLLDPAGTALAQLSLPAGTTGVPLVLGALTLAPTAPSGIKTIPSSLPFVIQ